MYGTLKVASAFSEVSVGIGHQYGYRVDDYEFSLQRDHFANIARVTKLWKFINDFANLRCEFFRLELAYSANYVLPGNYSSAKPPEEPTIVELDFIIREFVDINDRRNVST